MKLNLWTHFDLLLTACKNCAGAWHTLAYNGEDRLLVPLLVTGCKIWHLRVAGCFFPKMAWLNTLQSLQDSSQVTNIDWSSLLRLTYIKNAAQHGLDAICKQR